MILYPVASSSRGNCTYVQCDSGAAVLVDVGVGPRVLNSLLCKAGFCLSSVCAILITHEHSDHVSGLCGLTKQLRGVPIYAAGATLESLVRKNLVNSSSKLVEVDFRRFEILDFSCDAFSLMHDSVCCFGFCLSYGSKKIAICTDLGCITQGVLNSLKGSSFVLLESNFDVDMLKNGKYSRTLKRRIASRYGHLSNDEAAKIVCWLVGSGGVKRFLLGHLSQNNNSEEVAIKTVESILGKFDFKRNVDYFLDVAPVKSNGTFFEV